MAKRSLKVLLPVAALGATALAFAGFAPRIAGSAIPTGADPTPAAVYSAILLGSNEAQAADTDGSGSATAIFDRALNRVCFRVEVARIALPASGAHIHSGVAGVNGPIVVDFTNPGASGVSEGCATPRLGTTAADIANNPAGFYFNVHTTEFPAGAVRGQLPVGLQPSGGLHLLAEPLRTYDSRVTGGPLTGTHTINLRNGKDGAGTNRMAVPPGASGVMINLTVTGTEGPAGWAKVYSNAVSEPATSAINWSSANADVANSAIVAVDVAGSVKATTSRATHLVIDVVGYTL